MITLWHVIEHVPRPAATLAQCHRLLAPGGFLVLGLPNDGNAAQALATIGRVARRLLGLTTWPRYQVLTPGAETHLSHYAPQTIRRRLQQSGFQVGRIAVDDAIPIRSIWRALVFRVRVVLTRLTPWHFGTEMLLAARKPPAGQ